MASVAPSPQVVVERSVVAGSVSEWKKTDRAWPPFSEDLVGSEVKVLVDGSSLAAEIIEVAEAMAELDGLNGVCIRFLDDEHADEEWHEYGTEDILFVREEPVASPVVAGGAGDVVVAGSLVAGPVVAGLVTGKPHVAQPPQHFCSYCGVWMSGDPESLRRHYEGARHKDRVAKKKEGNSCWAICCGNFCASCACGDCSCSCGDGCCSCLEECCSCLCCQ